MNEFNVRFVNIIFIAKYKTISQWNSGTCTMKIEAFSNYLESQTMPLQEEMNAVSTLKMKRVHLNKHWRYVKSEVK